MSDTSTFTGALAVTTAPIPVIDVASPILGAVWTATSGAATLSYAAGGDWKDAQANGTVTVVGGLTGGYGGLLTRGAAGLIKDGGEAAATSSRGAYDPKVDNIIANAGAGTPGALADLAGFFMNPHPNTDPGTSPFSDE